MPARNLVSRDVRRLTLGADPVEYVLVRRRGRRGVGLKVDENGLTVSAPSTMPLARIESMVRESERWVLRKIAEWRTRQVPPVRWEDGAELPCLGLHVRLRISRGPRTHTELVGDTLHVAVRALEAVQVRRAVVAWYKRVAREHLERRLRELALEAGIAPPRFFLS